MEAGRKGEGSEGEHGGDQSGISQSIPCWTVCELVAVSRHENKHRQNVTQGAALHANTHTHTLLSKHTESQTLKHIIIIDENTKINVIDIRGTLLFSL